MTDYERIAAAIAYARTHFQAQPDLDEMARQAHWSPAHFQRKFQAWAGVSPKKFLQYLSLDHAKTLLRQQHSVATTAYETGFSGPGRLHDLFVKLEAMTPGEYRQGGAALTIAYSFGDSPFGRYLVASTPKGICKLVFPETDEAAVAELRQEWPQATITAQPTELHAQVAQFFSGDLPPASRFTMHLKGTPFQLKVWAALLSIAEGQLSTYSQLARVAGHERAVRAVGTAVGDNPISYLIPCHRVIRQTGELGQYRWGVTRKVALVGWEAARVHPEALVAAPSLFD